MPRPRPPKSDLEKQHDAERMRRTFTKIAYNARREEAAAFKSYCERRGQTVHSTLRAFVLACIAEDSPASPPTETTSEHKDTPEGI